MTLRGVLLLASESCAARVDRLSMIGSKVEAMKRIARETDTLGGCSFPMMMLPNMKDWQRAGLVTLEKKTARDEYPNVAKITDQGRALAKKSMSR